MSHEAQVGLSFRIQHPEGRVEQLLVDAERALVGSAAHCEVRLPPELASGEHVEVVVDGGQVHLTTRSGCRAPALDGATLSAGVWHPRGVLDVGGTRMTVEVVDLTSRRRPPSPFWLLAPVPIVIFIVTFFVTRAGAATSAPIPPAPRLFDAPVTTCPAPANDLLRAFAAEKFRLALARRERGPFSPADAVAAVGLFEVAAACYRLAKLPEEEREAAADGTALRQRLEEEYHVRRVRLEHAYRVVDPVAARRELDVLIPLTSRRRGPYTEWLASVDRYDQLELDKRAHKGLQ